MNTRKNGFAFKLLNILLPFINREYDAKYGQCIESSRAIRQPGVKVVIECRLKPVQTIIQLVQLMRECQEKARSM